MFLYTELLMLFLCIW